MDFSRSCNETREAHLEEVIIDRVHAVDAQTMTDQYQHSTVAPHLSHMPAWRANTAMGRGQHLRFIYHASIRRNVYTETCLRERMNELPARRSVHISQVIRNGLDELYRSRCDTGPEPLADLRPELLADQRHPVHAEGTQRRGIVEEPGDDLHVGRIVRRVDRIRRFSPICQSDQFVSSHPQISRPRDAPECV